MEALKFAVFEFEHKDMKRAHAEEELASSHTKKAKKTAGVLFFWSRGFVKIFSNFYGAPVVIEWPSSEGLSEDIPPFLHGLRRTYPSNEHAYQALKCLDLDSADAFTTSGVFGSFRVFGKWPSKNGKSVSDMVVAKEKAWGECPGIIAKMVSKLEPKVIKRTWGVLFEQRRLSEQVWAPILQAKFSRGSVLAKALVATEGQQLVEYDRSSRLSYWGAKLNAENGQLVGANAFGELLMRHRLALL